MAFELTSTASRASEKINLEPQIVLEIDGVSTRYGVRVISKKTKIGDVGLKVGGEWKIGGSTELHDQEPLISLTDGTTTSIRQSLDPSKGIGSSISSYQVVLVDRNQLATKLITPGEVVEDMLGRRARIYLGFEDTSFPEDYVTIFRGLVDDIQARAGSVILTIASPDQKKRQTLFAKENVQIFSVSNQTTISLFNGVDQLLLNDDYPSSNGLRTYFKHGDEFIEYWRPILDGTLLFLNRAQLGSTQGPDLADDVELETFYTLEGNVMDLALKLMLSDRERSAYLENYPVTSFNWVDIDATYENALFFRGVDMVERYGVTVGDELQTSFASTNSFPLYQAKVTEIIKRFDGTVLIIDQPVTEDRTPTQTITLRSMWNNLHVGLGLRPDEVDIEAHLNLKKLALSSFNVKFYMKDEVNLKEFIEQELYAPAGAYSLPRKSKASVGLHIGPLPGTQTTIISKADIQNPAQLSVRRSLATNFANSIIYKFDEALNEDRFLRGVVARDEDSINRIQVGTKAMVIESKGMRASLDGVNLANDAAERRLDRYRYAAEYIENVKVTFKKGVKVEIGDIVLLDPTGLNLINSKDGNRSPKPKLYEVINKTLDVKKDVTLSLVDTAFNITLRYGLISPASRIKTGISQTRFVIEESFNSEFGQAEYLKWTKLLESGSTIGVKVRAPDFSREFQTTVISMTGNDVTVANALGFVPQAGDIMEFANYDFEGTSALQKALYAYMSDVDFADGEQYVQI